MVRPWISRDSVVVVAAVSAAAIVAVPLLQNGYARQAIEDRRWEDAERLAPLSAEVLSRKAEAAFASRDVPLAQRLAVAALRRAPLDVRALRILGLTAQRDNDRLRARTAMELAGRLSWRDGPTQQWIFTQALLAGDFATALQRADALLRQSGQRQMMFRALAAGLIDNALRDAVGSTLATDPPWRAEFFADSRNFSEASIEPLIAIGEAIDRTDRPLTADEAAYLSAPLITQQKDGEAWALLNRVRATQSLGAEPLLRDVGFERINRRFGRAANSFEWALPTGKPADAAIDGFEGGDGPALRVGGSVEGTPVAVQILVLPPGRYQLNWRARAERSAAVVHVTLSCRSGPSITPLDRRAPATVQWRGEKAEFEISRSCSSQLLSFVSPGEEAATWIDFVTITPERASTAM